MIKRFRWVILAMLAGGAVLWLVLAGGGKKDESAKAQSVESKGRESSRHQTGEVEKHIVTPLEKKVAEQERKLEDKKKVLSALAKAKPPIYPNLGGTPPPADTPEDAAKKAQAAQDFDDARREYIADRQLLEELKRELADEQAKAKPGTDSR